MMETQKPMCLHPNHMTKEARTRGLCDACYRWAQKLIKGKETTWKHLEKNGKCLPARRQRASEIAEWMLDYKKPKNDGGSDIVDRLPRRGHKTVKK